MQKTTVKSFHRGLDQDTDIRLLQNGSYIDAMNIKITNALSGRVGVVSNMLGIKNITDSIYTGLSGDHVIGVFPDRINNYIYVFIANNTVAVDRIVKYNPATNTWSLVVASSVLAFSASYPIRSFDVIENFRAWNDGNNSPRMIDISVNYPAVMGFSAYNHATSYSIGNNVLYNGIVYTAKGSTTAHYPSGTFIDNAYWELNHSQGYDASYFSTAVLVPSKPPTFTISTDTGFAGNYIVGKFLQFKYRFVYSNNQKSVFSPISEIVYTESDYFSPKNISSGTPVNNTINLTIPKDNANRLVTKIEVAARSGNTGDFNLINTITVDSTYFTSGYTYAFYNNGISTPIDLTESNQIYDDQPRTARAMRYSNNRMLYGGTLNGYAKTAINITTAVDLSDAPSGATQTTNIADDSYMADSSGNALYGELYPYELVAGDSFTVTGYIALEEHSITFEIQVGWDWADVVAYINANAPLWDEGGAQVFVIATGGRDHNFTFKSGARYQPGIQYFDEYGRTNGVLVQDETDVYIPTLGERSLTSGVLTNAGRAGIIVTIKHLPPSWARYYNVVWANTYKESLCLTTTILQVKDGTPGGVGRTIADISSLKVSRDNNQTILNYEWEKGDRLRFRTFDASAGSAAGATEWVTQVYDAEIINQYDNYTGTDGLQSIEFYLPNAMVIGQCKYAQIEIYRPAVAFEANEVLFNESPIMYNITGGYHMGDTNQTGAQDAVVNLTEGDAYYRLRKLKLATETDVFVESYHMSDFVSSEHFSKGRVTAVIDQGESDNIATIFYSEAFIPNTNINGLNRIFPDDNYEEYNKAFGSIQLLHDEGDSVIMIQEDKVSKVMVNQSVMYDAQGNANYLGSANTVLSTAIPYAGEYGIQTPFSFTYFGNRKYWVDLNRGAALRLSVDGITEISRSGLRGWFYDKCKATLAQTSNINIRVYGLYDPMHDEYIMSFPFSQKTVCYNEEINEGTGGFSSFMEFHSLGGCNLDNKVFYCTDTMLYEMNQPSASVSRNAVKTGGSEAGFQSYIKFSCNDDPAIDKSFLAIVIDGNAAWDTEITTEEGQASSLLYNLDYRARENEYHAAFLRDQNTPNISNPMLEGDKMRGKEASVKLTMTAARFGTEKYIKLVRMVISNS